MATPAKSCATCAHFGPAEDWDVPPGFGRCMSAPMASDITKWDDDCEVKALMPEFADTLKCVMDGSSYRADLYVSPRFCCIDWIGPT